MRFSVNASPNKPTINKWYDQNIAAILNVMFKNLDFLKGICFFVISFDIGLL